MAMETNEEKSIIDAIEQIVGNCIQGGVDIRDIPMVDFELLFLHIRARSVGEMVDLQYKCNNDLEGKPCGNLVDVSVDLLKVSPTNTESNSNIKLSSGVGITLKYPTLRSVDITSEDENAFIDILYNNFDYIYDDESIYYSKDILREEFIDFVESLTGNDFKKIKEFFLSLPKLSIDLNFNCTKCGYSKVLTLEGIKSFF